MELLYRRQMPRAHPLRDEHEYVQYLNKKDTLVRKDHNGMYPPPEPQPPHPSDIMPSANEIMLGQSIPMHLRLNPMDAHGYDQTRFQQQAQNSNYKASHGPSRQHEM